MRFFVAFAVLGAIALGQDCIEEGDAKGTQYRGKVAVTANGYRCQKWASQAPNEHTRTPANYPDAGLDENYCRNPDDHTGLWCYNDEGTSPRWVDCDQPKCGQYLVKVICDDIANIYIDGVEKVVPGTGAWNQLSKFYVPATTTTIGIQCRNTGGPYGIMATVQNEAGETFVVSDNSWSCSNAAQDGWAAGGFAEGDSWKPAAYYYGHPPYLVNKDAWRGMSNDKKVIWTASAADTTVYCRKDLPKPTDLTLDVICDDISTIFVDGEQRDVAGTGAWNQLASVRISGDTKVVGVQCRNTGGPYGIMAQILDGAKKVVAVSDDSWSCSNAAEDGWSTGDFVEGDNWKPAAYFNGHPPYKTAQQTWKSMSLNKRIIWTASGADTTVYCRKVMPAAAPPKLAISAAWKLIPGGLTKISKGNSGVWGVNRVGGIYRLNGDGSSWTKIPGGLVQVSSGASVWGVNGADQIYRYKGGNQWENIVGRLKNVDVSDNNNVWGVNGAGNIYRWLGTRWEQIGGAAIEVSVGNSGVWVVNSANNIFYRIGTYGDSGTAGTGWTHVPGKLKWISSGNNIVIGVNAQDDIFYRSGMSADTPTGTGWNKVAGKLMNIDILDDEVVGTNSAMNIFRCPMVAPPPPVKYAPCDETDSCVREAGSGALLSAGSQLVSKNGRAKLVMQDDGNLVVYCVVGGEVLWNSESNGKGVDSGLKLQDDGNMVLYAGDAAVWDSKTNGNTDAVELVVQNDHNVVLYSYEDRSVLWKTDSNGNNCPDAQFVENCAADKCIRESQVASTLSLGKKIASKNGKAVLTMQADGNLVLTCSVNKNVLWKSDTSGVAGGLKFQSDGNLVLYDADNKALWASDSSGNYDNAELVVQDDMNVVLYNSVDRTALWATDTDGAECADPPSTVGNASGSFL